MYVGVTCCNLSGIRHEPFICFRFVIGNSSLLFHLFFPVKLSAKPTYSTRRRKSVSKPKVSSIFTRSTSESQLSTNSDVTPPSPGSSTYSFPSVTDFDEQNSVMNGEIEMANNKRTFSMSSTASDSSESDSGELSPREIKHNKRWPQFSGPDEMARTIVPPVKTVPGGATIRKRLYASKPGKTFVAIRDYRPFMAGELALEKGDEVEGSVALLTY